MSVRWYGKAAEQGESTAAFNLGFKYANGRGGLAKDDASALSWYRKAADPDGAIGMSNLGVPPPVPPPLAVGVRLPPGVPAPVPPMPPTNREDRDRRRVEGGRADRALDFRCVWAIRPARRRSAPSRQKSARSTSTPG